jgi:hypothetical protein
MVDLLAALAATLAWINTDIGLVDVLSIVKLSWLHAELLTFVTWWFIES